MRLMVHRFLSARLPDSPWRRLGHIVVVGWWLTGLSVAADGLPSTSSRAIYGDASSSKRLVIGSVTNAPKYNFGQMQGISRYMLERVRDLGVEAIMVVTIDSHEQMTEMLRDGHVDWVSATPYAAIKYEREAGAQFLLTKKNRGRGAYHSVFFARSDSNIQGIGDLVGKTIAFEKPGSTSAYFLPAIELLGAGFRLVRLESHRHPPPPDAIGYLFSGDEVNSSTWVHKRIVDAAAFSNEDWGSEWRTPAAFRQDMSIFYRTTDVPRSLDILRAGIDPLLRTRIQQSLLDLNNHPDAQDILHGYYGASEFALITEAQQQALDKIRGDMDAFERTMAESTDNHGADK
ncbi:MAG: phosphate/phosphite/phosphonate ABC transporter substrate-binding protein [Pseudomonadota bacterium]